VVKQLGRESWDTLLRRSAPGVKGAAWECVRSDVSWRLDSGVICSILAQKMTSLGVFGPQKRPRDCVNGNLPSDVCEISSWRRKSTQSNEQAVRQRESSMHALTLFCTGKEGCQSLLFFGKPQLQIILAKLNSITLLRLMSGAIGSECRVLTDSCNPVLLFTR
jgi:hypothetical protein